MRACSPIAAVLASLVLSTPLAARQQRAAQDASRQRPLEGFACDRNDLTAYTGAVIGYVREVGRTTLRIRTDWDTTEQVTLRHAGTDDPSAFFRLGGKPFMAADWARIERSRGVLRPGARAAAWVCADGQVVVDWMAPRE